MNNASIDGGVMIMVPGLTTGVAYSTWTQSPPQILSVRPYTDTPDHWVRIILEGIGPKLNLLRRIICVDTNAPLGTPEAEAIFNSKKACKLIAQAFGASLSGVSMIEVNELVFDQGKRNAADHVAASIAEWLRSGDPIALDELIPIDEERQHDRSEARALAQHVLFTTAVHQGALN